MLKKVKKIRGLLCCLVILGMLAEIPMITFAKEAGLIIREAEDEEIGLEDKADAEEIRILFVGNSLTAKNQSPQMVAKLAAAGGHPVYVKSLCMAGRSLKKWANKNTKEGKKFYQTLEEGCWDYVVLQDKSTIALDAPKSFKKAVKKLAEAIRESGGEVVLNMTWAHQEESEIYEKYVGLTQKKFQKKNYKLYTEMGEELNALVANSGVAFWRCGKLNPEINLYSDERHPTRAGSYLSACTIYAAIFQEDIPEKNLRVPAKTAAKLRQLAEKVTFTSMGDM